MARQFTTGFETGKANEHNGAYAAALGCSGAVDGTLARTGKYSYKNRANVIGVTYFSHSLSGTIDEIFIRYAYRYSLGAAGGGTTEPMMTWAAVGSDGISHVAMGHDSVTYSPTIYRGGGGGLGLSGSTPLGTADYTLKSDRWYVIEAQVKVDNTAGTVVIKVNNTTVLSYVGDTAGGATDTIAAIRFGASGQTGINYSWLDDIAVNDTMGSYQNTWPGLGGVYMLKPNADGAVTEWTPSTGTAHYALVDETPANTTDWVQAVTAGDTDLFGLENSPTYVNTINLVEVVYEAAVTESGYNTVADVVRQGTVNYPGGTATVVSIAPGYGLFKGTAHYVQPNGSGAWGTVEVDALQAGVEIV